MASLEQPLKKRRLYGALPKSPEQPSPSQQTPPLSQEEILRKRRNKDEIRSLYECYKRIRACLSQKDNRLMPDLEQAYLSLITASRGCTSVQRIVADLIPKYASFCPTALEAAAKVVINMYNWSLALISRGEDTDGVAFEIAKTCIFGLADICCTVSVEAPASSVIRGICGAVFLNVLTFFVSSFEGKNIFEIVDTELLKLQYSTQFFSELKQAFLDKDDPAMVKLSKFRALCFLRIFFLCPKNFLAACFDLFRSSSIDRVNREGLWFLNQVTSSLRIDDMVHPLGKANDGPKSCMSSIERSSKCNEVINEGLAPKDNQVSEDVPPLLKNCLLALVIRKDSSLKDWIVSKFKKLSMSAAPQAISEITSALEGIFVSFTDMVSLEDCPFDSDVDFSITTKYMDKQYLMPMASYKHETPKKLSGKKGFSSRAYSGSFNDILMGPVCSQYLESRGSVVSFEGDLRSNLCSEQDSGGSRSMDFDAGEQGYSSRGKSSTPTDLMNNQLPSPTARKPLEFRSDSSKGGTHLNQVSIQGFSSPTSKPNGEACNVVASPNQHQGVPYPSATSKIVWYFDGEPAAMEIVSASKQLWVGSLGPDAYEAHVRYQFERFGPIELFFFFPLKGFALIEYRNIMDAVKARECMRGHSPWGARLLVKFMDIGVGTRGAINGIAVGSSCHVYVGSVHGQWARDEILHESMKVVSKGRHMVTDLCNEGALLIEFETPEEASSVMAHLRRHRMETNAQSKAGAGLTIGGAYLDNTRSVPARNANPGNMSTGVSGSPHDSRMHESPVDSSKTRQMSQLSSLLSSLCAKYSITQNSSHLENQVAGHYSNVAREEDRIQTNTLWINLPNISSCVMDDELITVVNLAIGNIGSVVGLTRTNAHGGYSWFIECSSIDAASTAFKNLCSCPGNFFRIEFRSQHVPSYPIKPESCNLGHASARMNTESHLTAVQSGHAFQSSWMTSGSTEMCEIGGRKTDSYVNSMIVDPSRGSAPEQIWVHNKPEVELHPAPGSNACMPPVTQGSVVPPPPFQTSSVIRPVYPPQNSSWDPRFNIHIPLNPNSPVMTPNIFRGNVAAPFLPASVTPLAHIQGSSLQHFDQMFSVPVAPPALSCPPLPQSTIPPPQPTMPLPSPPLPQSQPPLVPPPPNSPPPQLSNFMESSNAENSGHCLQFQWMGALCKSGVHYCTVYAHRVESDICKYSTTVPEPAEWPAKLDMTKRTDFRHVKSTFTITPPHKREVCWLLPSSASDHKGYHDFISYLRQRECAGVIKIPAFKSMWARLLFILPPSADLCSMLSISPNPSDCLVALVLPKETNE